MPYRWGQGWKVIPKINGNISAQRAGLGVVQTIKAGEQALKDLAHCTCSILELTTGPHAPDCPVNKEKDDA